MHVFACGTHLQVIYGAQKLDTCSMDSMDVGPNSNHLGVMITLRMRLECSIVRRGQSRPEQVYEVLNEIVVDRGSNSFLTNIEAYIGGRFITRVQVGPGWLKTLEQLLQDSQEWANSSGSSSLLCAG
jgi:hypothetical protein